VTVTALATLGWKARSKAIVAFTAALRSKNVLIASIFGYSDRYYFAIASILFPNEIPEK